MLKEYDDMKEEMKKIKTPTVRQRFQSNYEIMISFCLRCRKKEGSRKVRVAKTDKGKPMVLSKPAVCDSTKSRFIKQKEASGLLSSLGFL